MTVFQFIASPCFKLSFYKTAMSHVNILILGTDAAGKNHVGQLLFNRIIGNGFRCAFREGWLSASDNQGVEKEKSFFGHFSESLFLKSYPLLRPFIPSIVSLLLSRDLARKQQQNNPEVVVSHTALRLAAFHFGHHYDSPAEIQLSAKIESQLRTIKQRLNGDVVVLDIAHQTRIARVKKRGDNSDPFDRYMASQPELSERIEACLVHLACQYLDATVIENDDLNEDELLLAVAQASPQFAKIVSL